MVVPIEVTELFKLNKFTEDIKWLIYKNLWKHLYCIKSEMKNELLSKANLINCIHKFKSIFKPDEHLRYTETIEGLDIDIVNYTNYLDAFLYYLFVIYYNPDDEEQRDCVHFECVCSVSDLDNEDNNITIYISLRLEGYSTSDKMYILEHRWKSLSLKEQLSFYDRIDEGQQIPPSFLNATLT
jgi:hypothetical protein